jgi:O-6-methylguanine DNA methyltransferase
MTRTRDEMIARMFVGDESIKGDFIVAVRTTGIYCLPTCRPPRKPKPENVTFYATPLDAIAAGFRACKLCRPDEYHMGFDLKKTLVDDLVARVVDDPGAFRNVKSLVASSGISSTKLFELFRKHFEATPLEMLTRLRIAAAIRALLQSDAQVTEIAFDVGFESLSAFNQNFRTHTGMTPLEYRHNFRGPTTQPSRTTRKDQFMTRLQFDQLESPIGLVSLVVQDGALVFVDFEGEPTDRWARMNRLLQKRFGAFSLERTPNPHGFTRRLEAYFNGDLRALDGLPVSTGGTDFQSQVWQALREIPAGQTLSYGELAARLGKPGASRAVGMTNGLNPVGIVLPCHRVVGANLSLTGYAGGLERKRWLLEHEGVSFDGSRLGNGSSRASDSAQKGLFPA